MARNSSGTYSVPLTLQPGTTARASDVNQIATDAGDALTDSLSRSGFGGMLASFKSVDGSASMPGISFTADPDTGFRRSSSGAVTFVSNGVDVVTFSDQGITINGASLRMIGEIVMFAGSTAPANWVFCAGQALQRADYPALFSLIGTTYGAGDGSTTFNVPDFRGRVMSGNENAVGIMSGRLSAIYGATAGTVGGNFGSATHTLSVDEMPHHQHGGTTSVAGSHTHPFTIPVSGSVSAGGASIQGPLTNYFTYTTGAAGDHQHTFTTNGVGGGAAHANVQPTIVMNYIMKAR